MHRLRPRYRLSASKDAWSEEGKGTMSGQLGVGNAVEGVGRGGGFAGRTSCSEDMGAQAEAACAGCGERVAAGEHAPPGLSPAAASLQG